MPILSLFYGIIVRMYMEVGGKHNMPHIHAEYAGKRLSCRLTVRFSRRFSFQAASASQSMDDHSS